VFDIREVDSNSSVGQKQRLFAWLWPQLLVRAWAMGYEVVQGEVYRGPGEVARLAALGKGHPKTLHRKCLAGHAYLFRDGKYLKDTEDYRDLGNWWLAQHPLCRWGGSFITFKDGVHFSVTHGGIA
jgi:hypothetical protein